MNRQATTLALAVAVAALSLLYATLKPAQTVTETYTVTYTFTTTVTTTTYDEPLIILIQDPRDLALATLLKAKLLLANFTDPYTFIQSIYLAKRLGTPPDVIIAYWGPTIAALAEIGVLQPIESSDGLKFRNKTYGIPIFIETPLLICNKTLIQPPRDIFHLLELNTTAPYLIALYLDPVLLSPAIYGVGGAYYNGTYKALEDPKTVAGFQIVKKILERAYPEFHNYTAQVSAFMRGEAACILTIEKIQARHATLHMPANRTLAYYKAAYAVTEKGKKFLTNLPTLWPQLERLNYTTPLSAHPAAEPTPITRPGLDPLLPAVYRILIQIAEGRELEKAVAESLAQLRR